jgi:hypothetical protein
MDNLSLDYPAPEYCSADAASEGMSAVMTGFLERIDAYRREAAQHAANHWDASEVA